VNRVVGLLPGRKMAAGVAAVRWSNLQVVVVVDVALRAGHGRMSVRERESSDSVIECRRGPRRGVVALGAICGGKRGSGTCVRWVVGLLPRGEVASRVPAVGRGDL